MGAYAADPGHPYGYKYDYSDLEVRRAQFTQSKAAFVSRIETTDTDL